MSPVSHVSLPGQGGIEPPRRHLYHLTIGFCYRPKTALYGPKTLSPRCQPKSATRFRLQPDERLSLKDFNSQVRDGSFRLQPGERLFWEREIHETASSPVSASP